MGRRRGTDTALELEAWHAMTLFDGMFFVLGLALVWIGGFGLGYARGRAQGFRERDAQFLN